MIKFQEISYDYQVSIRELWSNFWYNKIIFFIIVLLSIFVSILYSTNTRRVFQADSLFTLGEGERPLSFLNNLPIEMRGLAPLSGNNSSTTRAFIERLTSRKFILIIADDLKLYDDKFFNDQDVEAVDPKWKSWIKTLINWPLPPSDKTQVAKWNVVNSYSKSVSIDSTDAGAIEVRVQHSDPERAAEITNFIVKKSIDIIQTENYENSALRLKYLSSVLADALEDLEKTQTAMKNFSLNNSALSTQSFAAGSVLLDDLRSKRETSTEALKVINQLKIFNSKKLNSRDDYLLLRKKFPLLDQSSFRRMLGVSEVINAWSWPNLETLNQVQESVRDRIASLDSEIKKLENDALKYAESSTELAKLLRDTKVAEAAYQVLIEQVKSQSIVAGFAPNQSKIIAHAEIPLTPTRPNIILILALGTTLGSFLGIILSIVFGVVKGVYYSKASLSNSFDAKFTHKITPVRSFRNKPLIELHRLTQKSSIVWPKQLILETIDNQIANLVMIIDTSGTNDAATIMRLAGSNASSLGLNIAIMNLSGLGKPFKTLNEEDQNIGLAITDYVDGCTEYTYLNDDKKIDLLFSDLFEKAIDDLKRKHQMIFIAASIDDLEIIYSKSIFANVKTVAYAKVGETKARSLSQLRARDQLEVVLYD